MRDRQIAESYKSIIAGWKREIYLLRLEEADIMNREHVYHSAPLPLNLPLDQIREKISQLRSGVMQAKVYLRAIEQRQQRSRRGRRGLTLPG